MTSVTRWLHLVLFFGLVALTACGASGSGDWYYHWNCNGDAECLATNPTGQPSGDLDEGPVQANCTPFLQFAQNFWALLPPTRAIRIRPRAGVPRIP